MKGLHISLLLCVALLASGARGADLPGDHAALTTVSGVYSVTFNVKLVSALPAGSTITCRARLAPNVGGLDLLHRQPSATAETAGLAAVTGSTATCATEIPFAWTLSSAPGGPMPGGLVLSYQIDAVSRSGLLLSSTRQNVGTSFPATSGRASLSINVAF